MINDLKGVKTMKCFNCNQDLGGSILRWNYAHSLLEIELGKIPQTPREVLDFIEFLEEENLFEQIFYAPQIENFYTYFRDENGDILDSESDNISYFNWSDFCNDIISWCKIKGAYIIDHEETCALAMPMN